MNKNIKWQDAPLYEMKAHTKYYFVKGKNGKILWHEESIKQERKKKKMKVGISRYEYGWSFGIMYESYLNGGCMLTIMLGIFYIDILFRGKRQRGY